MERYNFKLIESKWQNYWEKEKANKVQIDKTKKKFYCLEMFPYPSGKIHMGHVRNYTIGDVLARHKKMQGFNVLHPMGWDSFGMPAENAARQNNLDPKEWTEKNVAVMKSQLKQLGLSIDWDREISTCSDDYYKHQQLFFLELYEKGLVYRKENYVNWDPVDETVLANEQVIDGKGWRSGATVERKKLNQWFFNISRFSEDLLSALDSLDEWPNKVKIMQKNWIGKSLGCEIDFDIEGNLPIKNIKCFTTRPDTLFGFSFLAVSVDHPLSEHYKDNKEFINFKKMCSKTGTTEESIAQAEKLGFKTNLMAVNPLDKNNKVPVYFANFVLMDYGFGAVFGCPAHDQRDFDFAKKYKLEIKTVVKPENEKDNFKVSKEAYPGPGILINSKLLNGFKAPEESVKKTIEILEKNKLGEKKVNYRLRDWGISRQRYWGCPIPIAYNKDNEVIKVPKDQLPVKLPEKINLNTKGNPLDADKNWKNIKINNQDCVRETDTLDTFVDSSWYFLRFCSPNFKDYGYNIEDIEYWMPVDQYIGGVEHAVLHLLYSRFFIKALNKLNQINIDEPFTSLQTQGMVCHRTFQNDKQEWLFPKDIYKKNDYFYEVNSNNPVKSGRIEKMSKSKKNVIDPNIIINNYGADTARFFILSDSPPDRDMEWTESGVEGSWRFLNKLWNMIVKDNFKHVKYEFIEPSNTKENKLTKNTFKCIQDVTKSIEDFHFNNAIASIRTLFNEINSFEIETTRCISIKKYSITQLIILLNPICPHFCEEAWQIIGFKSFLANEIWPKVQTKYLQDEKIVIPIQVNGKRRAEIVVNRKISENEIRDIAISNEKIKKFLSSKPKKIIVIPNRIINIVI
mgnify:CR=1 FL=1